MVTTPSKVPQSIPSVGTTASAKPAQAAASPPAKYEEPPADVPADAPAVVKRTFTVTCLKLERVETAVVVMEEKGPHSVIRPVWLYSLVYQPKVESHPRIEVEVKSLEADLFKLKRKYLVTFQEG